MNKILLTLIICFYAVLGIAEDFYYYFPLDGKSFDITDIGSEKLSGYYFPTNIPDNDNWDVRNPERFRKNGAIGKGLLFSRELGSYACIDNFKLPPKIDELYVSFYLKGFRVFKSSREVIINCKKDSSPYGFAIFRRDGFWEFMYGDGKRSYSVKIKGYTTPAEWTKMEFILKNGLLTVCENGKILRKAIKLAVKTIPGNVDDLVFGNYSGINKNIYAYNGDLDEIIIADSKETVRRLNKKTVPQTAELSIILEPVTGNEKHFKWQKTFHTFQTQPIPVSFLLRGNKKKTRNITLVLKLPPGVFIWEAYSGARRLPGKVYKFGEKNIDLDGRKYTEYRTLKGEIRKYFRKNYGSDTETVSVAFKTVPEFKSGRIFWECYDGEDLVNKDSFVLQVLPDLKSLPQGRFKLSLYNEGNDIACHSAALLKKIAEAYTAAGIYGKGRWMKKNPHRTIMDYMLRDQYGFELFEVNIWGGPLHKRGTDDIDPPAVDKNGKKIPRTYCLSSMLESKVIRKKVLDSFRKKFLRKGVTAAIVDFEPWRYPAKFCFCPNCIDRFRKEFKINDKDLTPQVILGKYRRQWTKFWVNQSAAVIKMMADLCREYFGDIKMLSYTYLYDYDKDIVERQWVVPKDPRINEKFLDGLIVSLYHIDGVDLIDRYSLSRKVLKKPVYAIILLSRSNENQGWYTAPNESQSPKQIGQKVLLLAALGTKMVFFWPGCYIDGAYLVELNHVMKDIRKYENYLLDGKLINSNLRFTPVPNKGNYTVITKELDGKKLSLIFNFTTKKLTLKNQDTGKEINVPEYGVEFIGPNL